MKAARIKAQIEVAGYQAEQALLTYQQTVLSALGEVQNTIVSYVQQRNRVAALGPHSEIIPADPGAGHPAL